MTPEKMFHQMLGLGTEWEVRSCDFDPETGFVTLGSSPRFCGSASFSPRDGHAERGLLGEPIRIIAEVCAVTTD
jgi:hypothetical protein